MPVTITPLGTFANDGEPWPQFDLGGSTDVGAAAEGRVIYACLSWEGEAGIDGGAIGGSNWEVLAQASVDDWGLWSCCIARAAPAGSGSLGFNFTSTKAITQFVVHFFSVTGAAAAEVGSNAVAVLADDMGDFDLPLDVAAGGLTLAMAGLSASDTSPLLGFDWDAVIDSPSMWRKMAVGYRNDGADGSHPVAYAPGGSTRTAAAVSLAPGDAPEPVYMDIPAAAITLALPPPALVARRVLHVPAAAIVLDLPAPRLIGSSATDIPVAALVLDLPAPALQQRRVTDIPAAGIGLSLPPPALLSRRVLRAPVAAIVLDLPAPELLTSGVTNVPPAQLVFGLPVPTLHRLRVTDIPVAAITLALPAPELVMSGVTEIPAAAIGLVLPAPALLARRVLVIPPAVLTLGLPAPEIIDLTEPEEPVVEVSARAEAVLPAPPQAEAILPAIPRAIATWRAA